MCHVLNQALEQLLNALVMQACIDNPLKRGRSHSAQSASVPCSLKALTESACTVHSMATCIGAALCRTNFARLQYLRKNGYEDDIEENVLVFVVDAHELAVPDQEAKDLLAKAASAATTEIEAKKVCRQPSSAFLSAPSRCLSRGSAHPSIRKKSGMTNHALVPSMPASAWVQRSC